MRSRLWIIGLIVMAAVLRPYACPQERMFWIGVEPSCGMAAVGIEYKTFRVHFVAGITQRE